MKLKRLRLEMKTKGGLTGFSFCLADFDSSRPPEAPAPGSLPEPTWNAADATATISPRQIPNPPRHPKSRGTCSQFDGEIRMAEMDDDKK